MSIRNTSYNQYHRTLRLCVSSFSVFINKEHQTVSVYTVMQVILLQSCKFLCLRYAFLQLTDLRPRKRGKIGCASCPWNLRPRTVLLRLFLTETRSSQSLDAPVQRLGQPGEVKHPRG